MAFHSLKFRTFSQATEDEEKVSRALKFASGTDSVTRSVAEGYHGNKIIILTATVRSQKEISRFFERLTNNDLLALSDTIDDRVDDQGDLHLRLDKQKAFLGELTISDGEDVISVEGTVKAYPKRREIALMTVNRYLDELFHSKE